MSNEGDAGGSMVHRGGDTPSSGTGCWLETTELSCQGAVEISQEEGMGIRRSVSFQLLELKQKLKVWVQTFKVFRISEALGTSSEDVRK